MRTIIVIGESIAAGQKRREKRSSLLKRRFFQATLIGYIKNLKFRESLFSVNLYNHSLNIIHFHILLGGIGFNTLLKAA